MPGVASFTGPEGRGSAWKWWVCGLLLLATMINYMDRLTLNQMADRIKDEFSLNNEQYALIETVFSFAFAAGALCSGWLADRFNVWWLYPAAVVGWSLAGFATGFAQSLTMLMGFRLMLGLFESGHWPCALRTTQRILPPQDRAAGNAILQSGGAIGAIVTPLIVLGFLHFTDSWRYPFMAVGASGLLWVAIWLITVRPRDLALRQWSVTAAPTDAVGKHAPFTDIFRDRRLYLLAVVVVTINAAWHFFRVWLPLLLKEVHGYDATDRNLFTMAYYASSDVGTLSAGFFALYLTRRGISVFRSRMTVFLVCALLVTLSAVVAFLPRGPLLLAALLLIAFGSLGVFPSYYSLTQELSVQHQGKVTGTLGCVSWIGQGVLVWLTGLSIDMTGSYATGLIIAGFMPLFGWLVIALFWRTPEPLVEAADHLAPG
ncbi:MAG: MFS transporter [Gemmataceae bacterium]|nr:MFS transporter [Gemmataceae bacterium]